MDGDAAQDKDVKEEPRREETSKLTHRVKSKVQFAAVNEEQDVTGKTTVREAKPTKVAKRFDADSLFGTGSAMSKKAARRRRAWRKFVMKCNPRYWFHVLNKKLPIILPDAGPRRAWDGFVLLLVVYVCFMVPYMIGFGFLGVEPRLWPPPPAVPGLEQPPAPPVAPPFYVPNDEVRSALKVFDRVIDAVFWVDIGLNFRTAYIDHTAMLVRDGGRIAAHYLRTWFFIDLVASVPWETIVLWFVDSMSQDKLDALMLLRVPRLLRLARLLRVLDRIKGANVIRMLKLIFFIILVAHWITCLWFFMYRELRYSMTYPWTFDNQLGDNSAEITYYLQGYYNAFVLMIGNDIAPMNNVEVIYCTGVLIIGACFYAIIIGNVSLLVNNLNPTASRHKFKKDIINNAIRYLDTPNDVAQRVDDYFEYLTQHSHPGPDGMQLVSQLPSSMFQDISSWMYTDLVKKVPLFKECEEAFLKALVVRLKLSVYLPGEIIFRIGDVGHEMYFITKGTVAVLNSNTEMLAMLQAGGFFGELALLATARRTAQCVALNHCDLSLLMAHDLVNAMRDFPDSASMVRGRAVKRLNELQVAGQAEPSSEAPAPRHLKKLDTITARGIEGMSPHSIQQHRGSLRRHSSLNRSPAQHGRRGSTGSEGGGTRADSPKVGVMAPVDEEDEEEEEEEEEDLSTAGALELLTKVQSMLTDLNGRLDTIHGRMDDVNDRLQKVEAAPAGGADDMFGGGMGSAQRPSTLDYELEY
mmetsp:Transcript_5229/g.11435  ORF Transcript_5229/g.11435 Transcript_5229/m.11435 type:complete len:751 (+) Transcript_5229:346-2598(+)